MARSSDLTQPFKVYRNSECFKCSLNYTGELKIKEHPETKEQIIICKTCYSNLQKELNNKGTI